MLLAAVVTLLLEHNAKLYFHTANYEDGDPAANSLSVLRAEHGQELYGNYSRWHFHHPGPAVFYGEGWSELALYRWLHVVQTPYTAQLLFTVLLMASFFAVGISVAARWVRGGMFPVLALSFAALHFVAVNAATLMLINWPPYVVAMTMFAFLVTSASVLAGQGEDLPLFALTGCFLLHMHVAQPLFVLPMLTLAYVGLAWSCWRRRATAITTPAPPSTVEDNMPSIPTGTSSVLPWRVYRRAHGWAFLIALLFALPLLVDLVYGSQSNFAQILEHLRTHQGHKHPYLASLDYFLRFAVYQPSLPQAAEYLPPGTNPSELLSFAGRHYQALGLWLAALCSPLLALAVRVWRGKDAPLLGATAEAQPLAYASPSGRWRFLGSLTLVWAVSVGLTLVWGHIQDGDMYYFNAWFDYMIWFLLALLAAGSLTDALDGLLARAEQPLLWRGGLTILCTGLAVLVVVRHPERFVMGDDEHARMETKTITSLLDVEPVGTPRAKLLLFPARNWPEAWPDATTIAVALTRRERTVDVLPSWSFMFGHNHVLGGWREYLTKPVEVNPPFEVWHVVPSEAAPALASNKKLSVNYTLVPGGLSIDPVAGFQVTCAGKESNCAGYFVAGWSVPEKDYCWTAEKDAWLQFQPQPVPGGSNVQLTCDLDPFLCPGKCDTQRLTLFFNGLNIGSVQVTKDTVKHSQFVVPGEVWNKYSSAFLVWDMPDAVSPQKFVKTTDDRLLAFSVRSISFAAVPAQGTAESSRPPIPEVSPAAVAAPPPTPAPQAAPPASVPAPPVLAPEDMPTSVPFSFSGNSPAPGVSGEELPSPTVMPPVTEPAPVLAPVTPDSTPMEAITPSPAPSPEP